MCNLSKLRPADRKGGGLSEGRGHIKMTRCFSTGLSKRNGAKLRESFCLAAASHSRTRQAGAYQNSPFFLHNSVCARGETVTAGCNSGQGTSVAAVEFFSRALRMSEKSAMRRYFAIAKVKKQPQRGAVWAFLEDLGRYL